MFHTSLLVVSGAIFEKNLVYMLKKVFFYGTKDFHRRISCLNSSHSIV